MDSFNSSDRVILGVSSSFSLSHQSFFVRRFAKGSFLSKEEEYEVMWVGTVPILFRLSFTGSSLVRVSFHSEFVVLGYLP